MEDFTTSVEIEEYIAYGSASLTRESDLLFFIAAVQDNMERGWKSVLRTLLRLLRETGTRNCNRPCCRVYISAIIKESLYFNVRSTIPSIFSIIEAIMSFRAQKYKKNFKTLAVSKKRSYLCIRFESRAIYPTLTGLERLAHSSIG